MVWVFLCTCVYHLLLYYLTVYSALGTSSCCYFLRCVCDEKRTAQLNSTQLNSTQLNSTQLNSTQQLGTTTRMHRSHEIFGIVFNTKLHSVFAVCIRSSSLHAKFQHHTKHAFSFFSSFPPMRRSH
jgi:hypothetical protein